MNKTKEILKEAESKEELEIRLAEKQRVYNLRKEELQDEDIWGAMSKSTKKIYLTVLQGLEDEVTKIQRRLQRIATGQPEIEEPVVAEGIIGNTMSELPKEEPIVEPEFDIEKEIIASEDPIVLTIVDASDEEVTNEPGLSDLILKIEEVLSKFKPSIESQLGIVSNEDVNSDSDIEVVDLAPNMIVKAPNVDDIDGRNYLLGDLEEGEGSLEFTDEQISDIIYDNYYLEGGYVGQFIIEVPNDTTHTVQMSNKYKIVIDYSQPSHLKVYPKDKNDAASQELSKKIEQEILYQLKLKGPEKMAYGSIKNHNFTKNSLN